MSNKRQRISVSSAEEPGAPMSSPSQWPEPSMYRFWPQGNWQGLSWGQYPPYMYPPAQPRDGYSGGFQDFRPSSMYSGYFREPLHGGGSVSPTSPPSDGRTPSPWPPTADGVQGFSRFHTYGNGSIYYPDMDRLAMARGAASEYGVPRGRLPPPLPAALAGAPYAMPPYAMPPPYEVPPFEGGMDGASEALGRGRPSASPAVSDREVKAMAIFVVRWSLVNGQFPAFGPKADDLIMNLTHACIKRAEAFGFVSMEEVHTWQKATAHLATEAGSPTVPNASGESPMRLSYRTLLNSKISEHWSHKSKVLLRTVPDSKFLGKEDTEDDRLRSKIAQWLGIKVSQLEPPAIALAFWRLNKRHEGSTLRDELAKARKEQKGRAVDGHTKARERWIAEIAETYASLFGDSHNTEGDSRAPAASSSEGGESDASAGTKAKKTDVGIDKSSSA